MRLYHRAMELLETGRSVAIVTVIHCVGSTPRHPGAHMLVCDDGSTHGTIGGGRIELEAVTEAVEVAAGAPARRLSRHLVRDLAMCCGGAMELYLEPAAASRAGLAAAVAAEANRDAVALVTPLTGAPKRIEAVDRRGRRARAFGELFYEPILPLDRLILFGGGHVARAIGPLAAGVGFEVVVCDDGEVESMDDTPSWAHRSVNSFDVRDVERELGPLGPGDYAVIVSRDHAIDQEVLERLLVHVPLSYLGMIGSRGKVGRFRRRLEAKGLATPERWARLHAPVGLDIGAETPAEIAISIVGQLVAVRNRTTGELA